MEVGHDLEPPSPTRNVINYLLIDVLDQQHTFHFQSQQKCTEKKQNKSVATAATKYKNRSHSFAISFHYI
jgi:hypothetical protein